MLESVNLKAFIASFGDNGISFSYFSLKGGGSMNMNKVWEMEVYNIYIITFLMTASKLID